MCSTLILVTLVLLYLCHGADSDDIFLSIKRNKTTRVYHESQNIEYKVQDPVSSSVDIICSVTGNTFHNNEAPILSWREDDTEWQPRSNGVSITHKKLLTAEDDGKELQCIAWSKALDRKWTISAHFNKKKTAREIMNSKPNAFKMMLIVIGAVIGGSILLILCYGVFRCLREGNHDEGCSDTQLGTNTVVYCEVDVSKKNKNNMLQESDEPLYCQVGIENKGCQIQEGAYVKFPDPDTDHVQRSDSLISLSSRDNPVVPIRNGDGNKKSNLEKKISINLGNTESSSDC